MNKNADDMSYDEFLTAMRVQNDALREQLAVLDGLPRARRMKWVHHEIRCKDCGDPVVQVMDTRPYRTVRYRRTDDGSRQRLDARWLFIPIADEEPRRSTTTRELVHSCCRCRQHEFTMADILTRSGRASTA